LARFEYGQYDFENMTRGGKTRRRSSHPPDVVDPRAYHAISMGFSGMTGGTSDVFGGVTTRSASSGDVTK